MAHETELDPQASTRVEGASGDPATNEKDPDMGATSADAECDRELTISSRIVQQTWTVRTVSSFGLLTLAVFYTLYLTRELVLPVVLAVLASILLSPLVDVSSRVMPRPLASGFVLLGFLAATAAVAWLSFAPAQRWLEGVPERIAQLQQRSQQIMEPMEEVSEAAKQLDELANGSAEVPQAATQDAARPLSKVIMSQTREMFGLAAMLIGLSYFLLASGDLFLRKVVRILPTLSDKKRAVLIAHGVRKEVARYLLTISLINAGLGVVLSLVFGALGVPNPFFWGILAGLFNFVPYLGALVGMTLLSLNLLVESGEPTLAIFIPAVAYLVTTSIEGTFVTPTILGQRLSLNPVIVFLGLLFWGWMWGVAGAFIAVPLLVVLKVACDHIRSLKGVGELLAR